MSNVQMKNEGSCAHCGTKLKPYDMFCEECLAITPRGKANTEHLTNYTCTDCGTFLHPNAIFCSECYRLAPDVQAIPITYKNYTGRQLTAKRKFTTGLNRVFVDRACPHCKSVIENSPTNIGITIKSPIEKCCHCQNLFLEDAFFEWSVASKHFRFLIKYFHFDLILLFIITLLLFRYSLKFGILFTFVCIFIQTIWNQKHKKLINTSYMRLKRNPEYITILHYMRYYYLDNALLETASDQ